MYIVVQGMNLQYKFYLYIHVLHYTMYMVLNLETDVMKVMGKWSKSSHTNTVCLLVSWSRDVFWGGYVKPVIV